MFKYGDNGTHFQALSPERHSLCCACLYIQRNNKNRMTKEILRERFKAKSAGQSLHQVTVNVGFTKSNKIDGCNCPNPMLERCQGLGFLKLFNNPSSTSDREYWQLHLLDVKWSTNNGMIQKTCAVSGHAGRTFLFLQ